jgi:hypothetical protein
MERESDYPWDPEILFNMPNVPEKVFIQKARIAYNSLFPLTENPDKLLNFINKCIEQADVKYSVLDPSLSSEDVEQELRVRYLKAVHRKLPKASSTTTQPVSTERPRRVKTGRPPSTHQYNR